jgi:hypothetical protein
MSNNKVVPEKGIEIPWNAACQIFKYDLIRKYVKNDGMSVTMAALHIADRFDVYDEKMMSYFKEIIAEKGLTWTM